MSCIISFHPVTQIRKARKLSIWVDRGVLSRDRRSFRAISGLGRLYPSWLLVSVCFGNRIEL